MPSDLDEVRQRAEWYPSRRSIDAVSWRDIELAISDRRYLLAELDTALEELHRMGRKAEQLLTGQEA